MIYLSAADVAALSIGIEEVIGALEQAFLAARRGDIVWKPKATISQPDGAFLIATHAAWPAQGTAIFHSIMGTAAKNVPHGAPHYRSVQLLTDYVKAESLAVIDGGFTSTILPAGITALAARRLARPDSRVATFVAAGLQARVNLDALMTHLPLSEIRILSRTAQSARAFADYAASRQLKSVITDDPEAALRGADVIVSSVPSGPGLTPFLDPAWVSPGAFVSAVDVGRSWRQGFSAFDRLATDDRDQAVAQVADGRLPHAGPYDTELAELVAGARPGRSGPAERIALIHPGNIVGVYALTGLIHERAEARGLGQRLG